jgi:hypothetical protein
MRNWEKPIIAENGLLDEQTIPIIVM